LFKKDGIATKLLKKLEVLIHLHAANEAVPAQGLIFHQHKAIAAMEDADPSSCTLKVILITL
jgi:hypothetical protein